MILLKSKIIFCTAFFAVLGFVPVLSQPRYRYSDISRQMLENSNLVVRKKEVTFEIIEKGKALEKVDYVLTVLNSNGIDEAVLKLPYSRFESIRNIKWHLLDQDGNPVKNRLNTEVEDFSAIAGYALYEDNRIKIVDPKYRSTPFTVEYSYEIIHDGLLNFPTWSIYEDYNIAVEKSVFKIVSPADYRFRFLEKNLTVKCSVTREEKKIIHFWELSNQPAVRKEMFSAPLRSYTPVVYSAPDEFEIDGHQGTMEIWDGLSWWIYELNRGKNVLSPATTAKVKLITDSLKTDQEKIAVLYRFMQDKVRYVSLQVGIGSWQPVDAETVDRLSYGDCKALSNYMQSLLALAGIDSYYALALAGEQVPDILDDFPSNQFNHALLCVPVKNDTVWLECTNQHIPAGYIGKFTDDRKVLLTGPGNGRLARTRAYTIDENLQERKIALAINPDGSATSAVTSAYSGSFYDDNFRILAMDDEDRKSFIRSKIRIPAFELSEYRFSEKRSAVPLILENISILIPGYCSSTGIGLIFSPNIMTKISSLPVSYLKRRSPVVVRRPYCESDTVVIALPGQYRAESLPAGVSVQSRFGAYNTSYFYADGKITYSRVFRLYKGTYPPSDYPEFASFFEKAALEDERRITILK